jgi:hypothetical protein
VDQLILLDVGHNGRLKEMRGMNVFSVIQRNLVLPIDLGPLKNSKGSRKNQIYIIVKLSFGITDLVRKIM